MKIQHLSIRRAAVLAICAVSLVIMWYNPYFRTSSQMSKPKITDTIITSPAPIVDSQSLVDLSSARAPFIAWPLRRLCTEVVESESLVPGLVFLCDNNSGGPGNIRNYILTCIRYAIEAGATGLQMPRIRLRSPTNRTDLFRGFQPFSYMFNEGHFRRAMKETCPHIFLFPSDGSNEAIKAIPGIAAQSAHKNLSVERLVRHITPKNFGGTRRGCDQRDPNKHTDRFRSAFREWMDAVSAKLNDPPTSWDNPMLVRLSWGVLWDWPVHRDGPELAATFGGLLRIREDILTLADDIVQSMRTLATSAAQSEGVSLDKRKPGGAFLGIHLRTEEDALSQWPTYDNQSQAYIHEAEKQGFRGHVAYLASGSESEAQRLSQDAHRQLTLYVKTKYDLVQSRELGLMKALSWDQQALVDFAVLLESDYFVGVSPSSFSVNVALKRHLQNESLYTRPWRVGSSDGRSWLVGQYSSYWNDWLYMFDGMWP